ncbi:MAG: gliding motility protein GldL, partial [bacterium]
MAGVSKSTDKIVNIIVCVGAAVVIVGAWAKILHLSFADIMLTVGLLTEALIFVVYAFLPPPGSEMAELVKALPKAGADAGTPGLKAMDKMLQEADITPTNLRRLSDNFTKLGSTVENMTQIADMSAATADYTAKTKEAATALGTMKDAYN